MLICGYVFRGLDRVTADDARKDYGSILPGHGGVMDRFDSGLFVLAMLWVIVTVTGNISV